MNKPNANTTQKPKKKRVMIGVGLKSSILVLLSVLLSFATALVASLISFTFIATSANIIGDRMLGRTLAITIDQDIAVRLYEETAALYGSLTEEERSDPDDVYYQAGYEYLHDEDYDTLRDQLITLVQTNDLKWIDLRLLDKENDRFVYIMDTEDRPDSKFNTGWWVDRDDTLTTFMTDDTNRAGEDEFNRSQLIELTTSGNFLQDRIFCTLAPFYHPDTGELIGYIGIGEEVALITDDIYTFAVIYSFFGVVFLVIVVFISRVFFRHLIVFPVRKLTAAAREYANIEDKLNSPPVFANVKIRSHDEIRLLADSMADMELDMASYMENLTALTAEQERIGAELSVAESIQTSMLPEELTGYEGVKDFEITAFMKPAKEVGGDFYDYFTIDDDHIGLSIADVSGKGVPAALFMAISKTLLKNAAMEDKSPERVIERVNRQLCENNPEMMFVTVWFGIYTVSTHTLVYVNAGHEYPAIYRAETGRFELMHDDHDLVLGFEPDLKFNEHTITLNAGDKIFVYTDGIPEATSAGDELFGTDRMIESLNRACGDSGSSVFVDITCDIERFISGAEQFDDMTMLLFERE